MFILDAYYVASESMKNSLLVGDYIIGNKTAYRIKTPTYLPFIQIRIPSYNLFEINQPKRNDIVTFRMNEFLVDEKYSQKDLIKRIVGLPGETIFLSNTKILINEKEIDNFFTLEDNSVDAESFKIFNYPGKDFSYMNYGPLKIPAKGDTIEINPKNIKFWQPLINYENKGKFISNEGSVITFKGKPIKEYVIKENYYFVLGDNILKSLDSRVLGFIPENAIESKVILVYLSIEPEFENPSSNFIQRIRFNRIFKIFN
jgi:signal peptidase I